MPNFSSTSWRATAPPPRSPIARAHPNSAAALFAAAHHRNAGMIAGNALMDRNAPPGLLAAAATAIADSRDLIRRWHGTGRQRYAVTPRFAITSSDEQLAAAGALLRVSDRPDADASRRELRRDRHGQAPVSARSRATPRSMPASACSARARFSAIASISTMPNWRCCATAVRSRYSARPRISSSAAGCSTMTGSPPRAFASRSRPMSAAARPIPCCAPPPRPTR